MLKNPSRMLPRLINLVALTKRAKNRLCHCSKLD